MAGDHGYTISKRTMYAQTVTYVAKYVQDNSIPCCVSLVLHSALSSVVVIAVCLKKYVGNSLDVKPKYCEVLRLLYILLLIW